VFQQEWDNFALEAFKLRQELGQTRQELATALYQHDAAIRVIARLTRERDEARDALSKVSVNGHGAENGDAMQIDQKAALPDEVISRVEETKAGLSKGRKKRAVPGGWATAEQLQTYKVAQEEEAIQATPEFLAVDTAGELALVGGAEGQAVIWSIARGEVYQKIEGVQGATITDGAFAKDKIVMGTSVGDVKVYDTANTTQTVHEFAANGEAHTANSKVAALAVHPSGEIVASVGIDGSIIFYDIASLKQVAKVNSRNGMCPTYFYGSPSTNTPPEYTACAFHPDGHLFAVASAGSSSITLYHTTTLETAATYPITPSAPVTSLSFSENGIWFAVGAGSTATVIDIRKEGAPEGIVKAFDVGGEVKGLAWDYTGQFLAVTASSGTSVQAYAKKEKSWSEPLASAVRGAAVAWGAEASRLLVVQEDGKLAVLAAQ
jgi:pre-mRNA-processing factor 19